MLDLDRAAERLAQAVRDSERIVVFGDYDVDGTTSATILSEVLEVLGGTVEVFTADRFAGGYGFSDPALDRALSLEPAVIVTCDCGSSDHERIARATEAGVDVIVVDHHLVPEEALAAVAFLNPHRPECGFPFKGLCSAGLALHLGAAVRRVLGVELKMRPWLDLVALGTIADVAPLNDDNRRLTREGLRVLENSPRPGLRALRRVARIRNARMTATQVAMGMAPRLNAPGRLGDSNLTLRLLRSKDEADARSLAQQVEDCNQRRREEGTRVTDEAEQQARERVAAAGGSVPALVVAGVGWHRGVVGITAARLVDQYDCPVAVIAIDGDGGHGSVRGNGRVSVHAALEQCAGLLDRFGGHAAAGGFGLAADRVEQFADAFAAAVQELGGEAPRERVRDVDVLLDGQHYAIPSARDLWHLEPVGHGNPAPLFQVENLLVEEAREVGDGHLKLRLKQGTHQFSAFAPRQAARAPEVGAPLRAWGTFEPDTWRGGDAVELKLEDWAVCDGPVGPGAG